MSFTQLIFDLIDLRSFSNLWFWIALCVIWSSASHWVMGVPYDMVWRARREGGPRQAELEFLIRIKTERMLHQSRERGPWLVGFVAFLTTLLGVTGWAYHAELAQALFLIFVPLCALGFITLRACLRVEAGEGQGDALFRRLFLTRISVQALGLVSIFVTAVYGMYVNLLHFVAH